MDKKAYSKTTIFSRLNPAKCEHLKPLSVYSRMITCDKKECLHHLREFSNPFLNFKIELLNNSVKKRKLDNSCPDDGYESPAKKSINPKALSPDLGCFMDYCSPPARQDSVSPFAISALLDKTHTIRSEIKDTANSQLHSEHVEFGSSTEPGCNKRTVPQSFKLEKRVLNLAPAFDCDVDDILCLNPVGAHSAGGFSENVESCKSINTFQNKPVLIPTVAHRQELDRGDWQVEEGREELKKEMYLNVKVDQDDKGYFSMSYIKDLKTGKSPPQSEYPPMPTATSSPLHRMGEVEGPQEQCYPESSSEQAMLSGQHVFFSFSDLYPPVSGPPLESVNSVVYSLEGDVEEMWNIGPPIFESSLCHSVTVNLNTDREHSRRETEEVKEPIHECQATLSGEEATLDTSYETTLPLQVQVKSVVVAPSQRTTSSSKTVAPRLPEKNATKPNPEDRVSLSGKCFSSGRSQRLAIFGREVEWEREKRLYVHSVTRHMNENPGTDHDVMTELRNLMTHVADQTPGSNDRQWQHPSDLTSRNYQRRFGNMMPKMPLNEWQFKNCTTHKRFAKVPKIFERSPFP
ncbi:uncharacterized protein LOC120795926 [Xiphias gladius]|uniref:uncharacterized protein LOC120795926 n=1 Tax=Xiphias gladius TaxID=8245 RepID=UPI001A9949C7|nr:uncharacterized protein LOC120795926 [Xiphias gladius]XP_039994145.1 uncharacterized protein LOC120795926 [Xiphias gladius]